MGKAKEGQAADDAGQKIQRTADKAAKDADTSHEEMKSRE